MRFYSLSSKYDIHSNTRYPAIKSAYGFNRRLLLVCGPAVNKDLNDPTPSNVNNLLARNRHRRYNRLNRFSYDASIHRSLNCSSVLSLQTDRFLVAFCKKSGAWHSFLFNSLTQTKRCYNFNRCICVSVGHRSSQMAKSFFLKITLSRVMQGNLFSRLTLMYQLFSTWWMDVSILHKWIPND